MLLLCLFSSLKAYFSLFPTLISESDRLPGLSGQIAWVFPEMHRLRQQQGKTASFLTAIISLYIQRDTGVLMG